MLEGGKDRIMNFQISGAMFILLGCAGIGFSAARNHKQKIQVVQSFLNLTDNIITELSCKITPLPELCTFAVTSNSCFYCIMHSFAKAMDNHLAPTPLACMNAVLNMHPEPCSEYRQCLLDLADILGNYDLNGQVKQLENVLDKWGKKLKELEADLTLKLRYYRLLGICVGASLVIILV